MSQWWPFLLLTGCVFAQQLDLGNWHRVRVRDIDCFPLTPPQSDNERFILVYSTYTASVQDMAANLLESLVSATKPVVVNSGTKLSPCVVLDRLDDPGGEANFATKNYYGVLRQKLDRYTRAITLANSLSDDDRILPIVVFLDADVQVFPSWFEEVVCRTAGLLNSSIESVLATQAQAPRLPPNGDSELGLDYRPGHAIYFQRESRKKLNSGVIIAHARNPAVLELFHRANASYIAKGFGDQTALQRTLNRMKRSTDSCTQAPGRRCTLSFGVLDKRLVNAGIADFQRLPLLVHHSHMSGKFKRENLNAVLDARRGEKGVHSGFFLKSDNARCSKASEQHIAAVQWVFSVVCHVEQHTAAVSTRSTEAIPARVAATAPITEPEPGEGTIPSFVAMMLVLTGVCLGLRCLCRKC
jgi:hypothetical protein